MTPTQPATDFVDSSEVCSFIKMKGYFKGSSNVWDRALDGVVHQEIAVCALGGLANHLSRLKLDDALRNGSILPYEVYRGCLRMDGQTMANLEIFSNSEDGGTSGTLYKYLDNCITLSGKRLLRKWLCHPLKDIEEINQRLNVVEELMGHAEIMQLIAQHLKKLPDLERFLGQIKATCNSTALLLLPLIGSKILKQRVKAFGFLVKGLRAGMHLLMLLQKEDNVFSLLSKLFTLPLLSGSDGLNKFLTQVEAAVDSDFPNYQVVCEELDWLPFYPGVENLRHSHGHRSKQGPPNEEAIAIALDVSLHWFQSFIKYSKWLKNPSNVKAARFLSRGHDILKRSLNESSLPKKMMIENSETNFVKIGGSRRNATPRKDLDSLDKALECVDEALVRLEELLLERDVSSFNPGKEHLKAACSDLEKIRKLKKEAEFLEVSFRAKADSLRQDNTPPEATEIQRIELIRNELKELETQVKRGAKRSNNEQEINTMDVLAQYSSDCKGMHVVKVQEKENFVGKSISRFKETTTDILLGTQLLAIDVAAATGLLIRVLTGNELTEKQKQGLRRTLTDLASVVPIGFLMLLPVTPVGHAAILAAIQRYIPSLIPSTYGPERLNLLRQLKKVKELDTADVDPTVSSAKP